VEKTVAVEKKAIAVQIALQTHVLKTCPLHNALFCDDDVDPSSAFALAIDLVKQHTPYVDEFEGDEHALTDLLSATIGDAPSCCPACATRDQSSRLDQNQNLSAEHIHLTKPSGACERSGLGQGLLQGWHIVGLGEQEHAWSFGAENELHVEPVTG
jgi:hypothetical protein